MTPAAAKRIQQRQVLAFLLAASALVLPTAGAVNYLAFFREDGSSGPWWVPFAGASNASEVIGTLLLVGALALGVVAWRGGSAGGALSVGVVGTVIVVAALTQGVAFGVGAWVIGFDSALATPDSASWQVATWTGAIRALLQAALCAATAAFALRWMSAEQPRTDP